MTQSQEFGSDQESAAEHGNRRRFAIGLNRGQFASGEGGDHKWAKRQVVDDLVV